MPTGGANDGKISVIRVAGLQKTTAWVLGPTDTVSSWGAPGYGQTLKSVCVTSGFTKRMLQLA